MDRHGLAASPGHVSPWAEAFPDHPSATRDASGGQPRQHTVLVAEQVQEHPAAKVREEAGLDGGDLEKQKY